MKSRKNQPLQMNICDRGLSPFECLYARCIIESEIAAQAAGIISDIDLVGLQRELHLMKENVGNVEEYRAHDKESHLLIAKSVRNSVLSAVVDCLWALHTSGPLWNKPNDFVSSVKLHTEGLDQHMAIYDALKRRDSEGARKAMLEHLNEAKDALMAAATMLRNEEEASNFSAVG